MRVFGRNFFSCIAITAYNIDLCTLSSIINIIYYMMADKSPNYKIGEFSREAVFRNIKLGCTNVTCAAGDLLKLTGVDSNDKWIMEKVGDNARP